MLDGSRIKVAKVHNTVVADSACRGVEAKRAESVQWKIAVCCLPKSTNINVLHVH